MIVVDTNVVAYLLIEGDRTREAQTLFARDRDWKSDGFVLIEFSNMLASYLRSGRLSRTQALALLATAEKNMRGLVSLAHDEALRIAATFAVSAYDARFLGVARSLRHRLVTEDARLRAAAPALTMSMAEALSAA